MQHKGKIRGNYWVKRLVSLMLAMVVAGVTLLSGGMEVKADSGTCKLKIYDGSSGDYVLSDIDFSWSSLKTIDTVVTSPRIDVVSAPGQIELTVQTTDGAGDINYSFTYKGQSYSGTVPADKFNGGNFAQVYIPKKTGSTTPTSTSSSSSDDDDDDDEPPHEHHFEWVVTEQPTDDKLGKMEYRCAECTKVLESKVIDNQKNVTNNTFKKINDALKGTSATIDTGKYYSFNQATIEKLASRSDLEVKLKFNYKGKNYEMTVPAGFDWKATLNKDGWAGFMYIGSFPGVSLKEAE